MSACAWCHRFVGGVAEICQFPNSDLCRSEWRKEAEAHAINDSYTYVGRHRLGTNWLLVHLEPNPTMGFRINLRGGAFHG